MGFFKPLATRFSSMLSFKIVDKLTLIRDYLVIPVPLILDWVYLQFLLRDVIRSYNLTFYSFFGNFSSFISIYHVLLQIHARIFCISTLKHVPGFLTGFSIFFKHFYCNLLSIFPVSEFFRIFSGFFQISSLSLAIL